MLPAAGRARRMHTLAVDRPDRDGVYRSGVPQALRKQGRCGEVQRGLDEDPAVLTYLYGLHTTLWQNDSVIDLGNLGGIAPVGGNSAKGISKSCHVVGTSGSRDGSFNAFFWIPETLIQDIGTAEDDV